MTRRRLKSPGEPAGSLQGTLLGGGSMGETAVVNPSGLVARDGDVLKVEYRGAKIAIGNFSNVDVDGAMFERTLRDGENVEQNYRQIYDVLKGICEGQAREKIAFYAKEVAKGRRT